MEAKTGKYGPFHSHKLADGSWCNGKGARSEVRTGGPVTAGSTLQHREQQRAWGKSKQLQIALQGLVQALIASGQAHVNTTEPGKIDAVIQHAEFIRFRIQEYADGKVGFDRAADALSTAPAEQFEDIPF